MGSAETATMIGGDAPQAGPRAGDEDAILLVSLTFAGHRYATAEWGSVFRHPQHVISVQGTKGHVLIDMHDVGVTVHVGDRVERYPLHGALGTDAERTRTNMAPLSGGGVTYGDSTQRPPAWLRAAMRNELDYFTKLVTSGIVDPALATLTDGFAARASIATADALTRSLQEKRTVSVGEITSSAGLI